MCVYKEEEILQFVHLMGYLRKVQARYKRSKKMNFMKMYHKIPKIDIRLLLFRCNMIVSK